MSANQFMLIFLESIKIVIGVWVGMIFLKVSNCLDNIYSGQPKGTQLKYIKTQGKWIFGIFIGLVITVSFLLFCLVELAEFKHNYTRLWKDVSEIKMKVQILNE